MRLSQKVIVMLAVIALIGGTVYAQKKTVEKAKPGIELGAPFADNAILQQQMEVPVWGWSEPGAKITVEFAGQKKKATAGKNGKWMVKLNPLKVSFDPAKMVITDNKGKKVVLENILVGEVWMASGQSNMQWIASKCDVGRVLQKQIAQRVAAGKEKQPVIREAKVTNFFAALHPIEHTEGKWSSDIGNFSAIAYAFAYKLFSELQVPIGILNCSFSQTAIQAWTPREGFADGKDEYTKAIYKKILESDPTTKEHKAAWDKFYRDIEEAIRENKAISTKTPANLNGNRDATWLFNARLNPMIPYAIRGCIWNQGYASQGDGLLYYNNLHSMIRGWRKLWSRPNLPVYFHQFYSAGMKPGQEDNIPSVVNTAEMRMGTAMARDIPNANMASQIDITGSIHYYNKTLPGQRLALHALKNQYGKDLVTDGPTFKSYKVKGNKLIVEFDHADGGLVVAETGTNSKDIATPTIIENGEDKVELFYIAGADRVWCKADVKIDGNKVILTSPKVKSPRGVSYATAGIGFQPNLYNRALLPATPFIYFDNKMVTKATWPDDPMKVDGVKPDPSAVGKIYEYRKMPLLSTQFRDNAVLQADQSVIIWGSTRLWGEWSGGPIEGNVVIHFSFAGIEKTIPVTPEMAEWQVALPPMKAGAKPHTLKVSCTVDGELAHERVITNIIFGDVWYVAGADSKIQVPQTKPSGQVVRMMKRKCMRSISPSPSRFSVAVSRTPKNRFASLWTDATGLAGAIGNRIAAKTGRPVGIILMQGQATKMVNGKPKGVPLDIKHWIKYECLKDVPSLMEDYKQIASVNPGNSYYNANARKYVSAWKKYWGEYITELMETKKVPDGAAWGSYPTLSGSVTTDASQAYNVMVHSFGPASFKGIIFLCSENMFEGDRAGNYGAELSALANGWKNHFGGEDPYFFYTIPGKSLSPKVASPASIKGKSTGVEINQWTEATALLDTIMKDVYK